MFKKLLIALLLIAPSLTITMMDVETVHTRINEGLEAGNRGERFFDKSLEALRTEKTRLNHILEGLRKDLTIHPKGTTTGDLVRKAIKGINERLKALEKEIEIQEL